MVITHHGGECIKIVQGNLSIALNPISGDSSLKPVRFGADIVLVSLNDPDFNGVAQVTHGDKEPLVISGPGEYEAGAVAVRGFQSLSHYKKRDRLHTIYVLTLEGMNLCFLGALGTKEIRNKILEELDDIHVLFVPIGGEGVLHASEAHDVAVLLQPHIVIPIHYAGVGEKGALERFLKEEGAEQTKEVEKLTIKKNDIESETGTVVVLRV